MKGVVLAGGKGTRLFPLTKVTNKHLLPVGKEPMIFHPIRQMVCAGITEILVVTSTDHMGDIVRCLGSGEEFGCEITYRVQKNAGGIADALSLSKSFAGHEKLCVMLGDNIFKEKIIPFVNSFTCQKTGARVLIKKVDDPSRFGIAALDERQIIEIEEKPKTPKSPYAVVGLYFFDSKVFDYISEISPSKNGELEITSVNNKYIEQGELEFDIYEGEWTDAGTFESLHEANRLLL
ncbi:MAG: NTP transferase domain-containing protein [Gammaproteobacteria bacterium]|nr:MAG: NTP transferase domain-containing protein [Gammaproteobacteria bacterium]